MYPTGLRTLSYPVQTRLRSVVICVLIVAAGVAAAVPARAQSAEGNIIALDEASVREALDEVERVSGFRFLYRDAVVAGRDVSLKSSEASLLSDFIEALSFVGIGATVDSARKQILLAPITMVVAGGESTRVRLSGIVVDDETGDRLPFATVSWTEAGRLAGIVTDASGRYSVQFDRPPDYVRFSYVGFVPLEVSVSELDADFAARLKPRSDLVSEVVVSANPLAAEVDSVWGRLLSSGGMQLHGESNTIRTLQALPAVSITGAMAGGTVVRGSRADGFQVLLDGVPVYSPSHFFGLFDAFNADALRSVGLYYGVSPADYAGPPGGTLSLITRGGSSRSARGRLALSSSSVSGTVEGPIMSGRGSFLLAGRRSLFDLVDWFDNGSLITLGLDIDRESSAPEAVQEINGRILRPGESGASFYDGHGKVLISDSDGRGRWILNGYAGGDDTRHEAERFVAQRDSTMRIAIRDVATENAWQNEILGLRREGESKGAFYEVNLFVSNYKNEFSKDDYPYAQPGANPLAVELLVDTLEITNDLQDRGASGSVAVPLKSFELSTGVEFHTYSADYAEYAAPAARRTKRALSATLFDSFASLAKSSGKVTSTVGLRVHYYSAGQRLRLSPRLQGALSLGTSGSVFLGYARSHQFVHQLTVDTAPDARLWTLSTEEQPPGTADQLSIGARIQGQRTGVQVEGYYKESSGIRQHETVVSRRRQRQAGLALAPWVHDYFGRSSGLELMVRRSWVGGLVSGAYTLSRSELRHEVIQDNEWVPADWDRRHQVVLQLRFTFVPRTTAFLQWHYGTGTPNLLANQAPAERARHDDYHRLDITVQSSRQVGKSQVTASIALYNAYNRNNTWYRTTLGVVDGSLQNLRIRPVAVDVYDLGFRPAFSLSVAW